MHPLIFVVADCPDLKPQEFVKLTVPETIPQVEHPRSASYYYLHVSTSTLVE
ncbi:hypothetical protein BRADI_3g18565v3 [Brachypodium distachyon]|uniref:Uncharacterized protein n=1 Tax=Brachypodium distachyon TaxID=15368 RepID=A0A0Q3I508_BRADI|nr:hypothetical protein BRADI_3g18565v3 [Brachypodium distachyon]